MTLLEQELTALGAGLFPETPDLARDVLSRLDAGPAPRRSRLRLRVVVALGAVALVAVAAVLAVPPARSTVLRWFGIGGVTVQVVDRLPAVPAGGVLQVGVEVPLADARRRVPFHVFTFPPGMTAGPETVHVGRFAVDEVTFVYGDLRRPTVLLTEASGALDVRFAGKLLAPGTRLERLEVGGRPALWIEGAPHGFFFVGPGGAVVPGSLRLARNALIWQRDGVVLRLEGQLTKAQALRLAESVR